MSSSSSSWHDTSPSAERNLVSAMSIDIAATGDHSSQPFQCLICQSRFTRHENLKRHAALHTRSPGKASYSCGLCSTTFSRRDLCNRHMKRKHPEHEEERAGKRFRASLVEVPACSRRRKSQDTERTPSLGSSADSRDAFLSEQWDSEVHVDVDRTTGPSDPSDRPEHTHQRNHSSASLDSFTGASSTPTNIDEERVGTDADQVQQSSAAGSMEPASLINASTDLDVMMALGTTHIDFSHFDVQLSPAATRETPLPGSNAVFSQTTPEGLSPRDLQFLQEEWSPSASQMARGLELYFTHVSYFVPFLHQPTFDASRSTQFLVFSMLCLGYQHGEDPGCGEEAHSGESLSLHCFHRARLLLASEEENCDDVRDGVAMVQAYLMLEICAMMYFCGKDSAYGLKMHPRMISLTRSSGLTQPTRLSSASAKDLDALWTEFIQKESQKRTVLAAHQIDALWYQLLSIPRSLSHLEIKHELPCPADCWTATSASEWAYSQLKTRCSSSSVQYPDAIRHFLSPNPDADPLPPFDPYGAINIAQFLLSSAREVSGWSAMTGRLSLERLEPLRSSLVALAPFIRPQCESADSALAALQEATWEIAMIELQIWSPSHTCGIIEGSVDAVLKESTKLASTSEMSFGTKTAEATQPHIDWFLRYLDKTLSTDSEPPWTALYAYKAFLIAWQLLRKQIPNAMQVVGIKDGDVKAAMSWARNVFQRRTGWRVGKMIMACLDNLSK